MFRVHHLLVGVVAWFAVAATPAEAGLNIQVNYSGVAGAAQYAHYFSEAARYWESQLVGYRDGRLVAASFGSSYQNSLPAMLTTVYINASVAPLDGPAGSLSSSGYDKRGRDASGYILTTDGSIRIDSADVATLDANGTLGLVVLHGMAQVLGFGTNWQENGVYQAGSGVYTGAMGNQLWTEEFGQLGPAKVELSGGNGAADAHWDEVNGGARETGIVDLRSGKDLRYELMTGWLNTDQTPYVSRMTLGSFYDIGFATSLAAIPEGSGFLFFGLTGFGVVARCRATRGTHSPAGHAAVASRGGGLARGGVGRVR